MPGLRERPGRRVRHPGGDGRDGLRRGAVADFEAGGRGTEVESWPASPGAPRSRFLGFGPALILGLSLLVPGLGAHADRVVLKNGQVFEDVVAIESESHVRLRLEGGEMRLKRSQVESVETTDSPYPRYLAHKQVLESSLDTEAGEWLTLARFAQKNGLKQSAREAALVAAELDSSLAGLAPLLQPLGYIHEAESGTWQPKKQVMAQRGLVEHRGDWVPVEQRNAELAREREALEARRQAAADERRTSALENAAAVALARVAEPRPVTTAVVVLPTIASFPVPWIFVPNAPTPTQPGASPRALPAQDSERLHQAPRTDLMTRQPGSLIPGVLDLGGGGGP